MQIHIDAKRRDQVYGALLECYRKREFPFNMGTTGVPQDVENIPPGIETEPEKFAFYLFCLCYFMTTTESIPAARILTRLYADRPEYFDPFQVQYIAEDVLGKDLKAYGLGFAEEKAAHLWIVNAGRLVERYEGSVLTLASQIPDYDTACAHIRNRSGGHGFLGFQYKMVSMILYYLMATDLMPFYQCPVPVDFHILRVSIASEVIYADPEPADGNYYRENPTLRAMRQATLEYCLDNNVSWLELSDVLWPFGRAMCQYNPGNSSRSPEGYAARRTVLVPVTLDWRPSQIESWSRSCGHCPIASSCRWNIPSANYYRKGELIKRGRREDPPQERLFDSSEIIRQPRAIAAPELEIVTAKAPDIAAQDTLC